MVISGERGGQLNSLLREIMRSPETARNKAIVSLAVCVVASSCWNHNCGWFHTAGLKKFSSIVRYWIASMVTVSPASVTKKYGPMMLLAYLIILPSYTLPDRPNRNVCGLRGIP
ncbi:hypothetical protein Trydic_g1589 [Trypoxylus dichotomus]